MARRVVNRRAKRKTPIGDYGSQVQVHTTTTRQVAGGKAAKVFTPFIRLKMKIETLGQRLHDFNGVNIEDVPTHKFTTRYRSDINAEHFLEFNGFYFEILDIEDPEERHKNLILSCRQTGSTDKGASGA